MKKYKCKFQENTNKKMNENKFKKKDIIKSEDDVAIPFINTNEDNKALNQLLYYVYDDNFVLMINELSTSILNYHKIISKCFANIRILLNKMGESPYLTAVESNCSNLENSFKKFYSNAKVVFRKMKIYRNEKFKKINNNKDFQDINLKNSEKKNGLTIIINNNNNNNNNINNTGEHGLSKMLSNEKKKNKDNKKGLNFKYNNNKIITYNDIKKNMKFDLAKKIKYLDKVSKNVINTLSKTSIQNKKSIIIYESELKKKRMYTTEKKEKVVKYNFFDIIQETNKLRNNSGDNNYKAKNKLFDINNINNNFLLRTTKEKKINGKFNISKNIYDINPKKLDSLIKSDFITNKKKSYFSKVEPKNYSQISSSTSKNKTKKNGAEKNESISNEHSDISFQKNKIQNKKNILNGGIINKNKKLEIVGLNKKNIIENKQNNNKNNKLNNKIKIIHKRNIKKGLKKKDIYNIIIDAKNKNSKNNILKNENFNFSEQNSKSNRSEYNNEISYNTNSDNKNKIHNYNTKINKMLLLKKSLSSSMNNLINNKPQKNVIIDSFSDLNNKN